MKLNLTEKEIMQAELFMKLTEKEALKAEVTYQSGLKSKILFEDPIKAIHFFGVVFNTELKEVESNDALAPNKGLYRTTILANVESYEETERGFKVKLNKPFEPVTKKEIQGHILQINETDFDVTLENAVEVEVFLKGGTSNEN